MHIRSKKYQSELYIKANKCIIRLSSSSIKAYVICSIKRLLFCSRLRQNTNSLSRKSFEYNICIRVCCVYQSMNKKLSEHV